jgi:hypothetical protein
MDNADDVARDDSNDELEFNDNEDNFFDDDTCSHDVTEDSR